MNNECPFPSCFALASNNNHLPVIFFLVDQEGIYQTVLGPLARELDPELIGKSCWDVFQDDEQALHAYRQAFAGHRAQFLTRWRGQFFMVGLEPVDGCIQGLAIVATDESAINRTLVQMTIKKGLEKDQFVLFTQPVVHLRSLEIVGYEALIRWITPQGIIMPDVFIPCANGLLEQISLRTTSLAVNLLKTWEQDAEKKGMFLSINIAPGMISGSFVEEFNEICDRSGIDRSLLHLEITEEQACDANLAGFLGQAKRRKHRVKLDDYGKEASTDYRMLSLPIDDVKFDKKFLQEVFDTSDRINYAMAASLVNKFNLCKQFYLTIICEGVETETQRQWLIKQNIEYGQGFLFGRPASP